MPYYIHGADRPDVLEGLIANGEAHWSYMDQWADRLILRGPTLSGDGEEHTGSVHVVDVDDRASAERFAYEEPYWLAGYYEPLMVVRAVVLLDRTEDRPRSLVTAEWEPTRLVTDPSGLEELSFLAVLADDAAAASIGLVAALRVVPAEATELVRPIADQLNGGAAMKVTACRWQRGGRSQSDS